jgi:DNA-binding response OmpR family regulator
MTSSAYDILFIDDDEVVLLVTGEQLRKHGFTVLTALDSSRALAHLENTVGLIVLDVNLGLEDGVRVMEILKLDHPDLPIIIYTNLARDEPRIITMLQRGAICYIGKSQPVNDLVFAIKTILGQSGAAASELPPA